MRDLGVGITQRFEVVAPGVGHCVRLLQKLLVQGLNGRRVAAKKRRGSVALLQCFAHVVDRPRALPDAREKTAASLADAPMLWNELGQLHQIDQLVADQAQVAREKERHEKAGAESKALKARQMK